ncbi:hypothetical protein CY35_08G032000 [Sphagnum magellanicum]|nr:hypothetical protein CY35_08G032000 [Sphagnum magellanicum]
MALNKGPPGSGHGSSSRQRLKQRFACTSGMLVVHEEDEHQSSVVHSTASATRNFFSSLSGFRPLVGQNRQRSWLVRDMSLPNYLDRLDTGSSSFSDSISGFSSNFGSALDLPQLFAVEDALSTGVKQVALENQQAVVQQSHLEVGQSSSTSGPGENQALLKDLPIHSSEDDSHLLVDGEVGKDDLRVFGDIEDLDTLSVPAAASGSTEEEEEEPFMVLEQSLDPPQSSRNGLALSRDNLHDVSEVAKEEAKDPDVQNKTSPETEIQQHQKAVSAAICIQAMYQSSSAQAAFRSKHAAALRIQSFYRGWLARRNQRVWIAGLVKLQACVRRNQVCKQYHQLRNVVLMLQRKWRFARKRKLQLQQSEVLKHAAIKVQSSCRSWVARKNFKVDLERVVMLQSLVRRRNVQKWFCQLRDATLTLQRIWRASKLQQSQLQSEAEEWAAVRIQSSFRGWVSRKNFKADIGRVVMLQGCVRRNQVQKEYQQVYNAVIILQGSWQSFKRQQRVQEECREHAALKIQSIYRAWLVQRHYRMCRDGVLKIQAWIRMKQVRRKYQQQYNAVLKLQELQRAARLRRLELCKLHECATAVVIQKWWRGHHQRQLYRLELHLQDQSAQRIQVSWRGFRSLQLLRAEKWVRERAAICLQAVIRGHQVRQGILQQKTAASILEQHRQVLCAVITIQSVFRAFKCRRDYLHLQQKVLLIQRTWRMSQQKSQLVSALLKAKAVDVTQIVGHPEAEEVSAVAVAEERFTEPKQPKHREEGRQILTSDPGLHMESVEAAVYPKTTDAESGELEQPTFSTLRPNSPSVEDWNNLQVDELDECLDTFLAALPLASHSRRQSMCLDIDPTPSGALRVGTTVFGRADNIFTPAISDMNSSNANEEQQWQDVQCASANEGPSPLVNGEGCSKPLKSSKRDEERLQQFAQVFLTMRQISIQQQRAQSAPPFPPSSSIAQLSSEESSVSSSPQQGELNLTTGVSTIQNGHVSLEIRDSIQTPENHDERGLSQVYNTGTANAQDVVLDMVELLKMMEQYCDREADAAADATSSKSISGGDDIEGGRAWNLQKNGYRRTSTAALGIKHFRLPDVNVVFIVLVAMVVYTRTVCRDVFSRTRRLHRKP